ncbi:MerR family transcriptional regulator [Streptomyces jumonjinensis]|uniref:MerR family transcriptional regulator n=1 Tax=Streptomyces jumonjinensis TaxID=1945 RepID=A0A646KCN3_STRJU|nr:MerR family transcriptional regulator [Streptomyces jumonjinensis]MQS99963.1 MerR family transcriptional regulator [Streptomyces jumonjinensis]
MLISEFSRRSGVSIPTIKYYVRQGLLEPGRAMTAKRFEYGERHMRRLRLVRALIGVRGLSVRAARDVVETVFQHRGDIHEMLGLVLGAHRETAAVESAGAAEPAAPAAGDQEAAAEVTALLERMGWRVGENSPAREALAHALSTLRSLGAEADWRTLMPYAELAQRTAALDLDGLRGVDDPLERAERAVLLTLMLEPALLALRRLAQEGESARRHSAARESEPARQHAA